MSSLLPLGAQHDATTDRLRRHYAAEAAQGALTMLRAHCLPANLDTDQVHGPTRDDAPTVTITVDTLRDLIQGAEYMAAESYPEDRNGRCSAYLYRAASRALDALAGA